MSASEAAKTAAARGRSAHLAAPEARKAGQIERGDSSSSANAFESAFAQRCADLP